MRRAAALFLLLLAPDVRSGEGEVRLLTDDAIPRYLARGQELARAKQWEKVVDVLHRVVVGDQEVFPDLKPEMLHAAVYSEDDRLFHPARELCLQELARLPPEGLLVYRNAFDIDARALFEAAEAIPDIEGRLAKYAEVYDRYLPSSVGDDALEKAADLNFALGRFYEALALYRRLVDLYPKDTDRDVAMVLAKACYCAARIGDREHRDVLLERVRSEYPAATVRIEDKPVRGADLPDHPLLAVRAGGSAAEAADWPLPGGNASRSRVASDLPEDLPRKPLWSFRLSERDARLTGAHRRWQVAHHDRAQSPTPQLTGTGQERLSPYHTVRPVIAGGHLLYKDGREILVRRVGSGTLRMLVGRYRGLGAWEDPEFFHPLEHVRPGTEGNVRDARIYEGIYRHYDYGGNTVVAWGDYLVVTEAETPPHELRSAAPQPGRRNHLAVYSLSTGKLQWAWNHDGAAKQPHDQMEAWKRDYEVHRDAVFHGPGVVAGGILYTIVEETGDLAGVAVWALDVRTGRVRFRTPLHYPDEVQKLVPRGSAVAVTGGVVYAVTHAGVVAAVDALPPGRVRWIARYGRNFEGRSGRRVPRGAITPGFAFNEPVVAGGKVIVAAADADELVALDAETGRLAWTVPRDHLGDVHYILGAAHGLLILAGDRVLALDLAKGEKVWGPKPLGEAWPAGRGFVADRYAYVPTRHANARVSYLERFDLLTGGQVERLEFDVGGLGNLLSVDGRLIAANGDEVMCFTTFEAELARLDAALTREGPRPELLLERALLSLSGEPKRRDQAREDFRRAIEAAEKEQADDDPLRVHAIENLLSIARERMDLDALAEARGILAPLAARPATASEERIHPYEAQIALDEAALLGRLGRGEEALQALEVFLDRYGHARVVHENRVVDAAAAAGTLRDHLRATNSSFRTAFEKSVRGRIEAARAAGDVEALRTLPERYGHEPPSEEAFFALAAVHEQREDLGQAEAALRTFLERYPEDRRAARAYLGLARVILKQGKLPLGRQAYIEALGRLDELGRAENRELLAELARLLEPGRPGATLPRLRIPLHATPLDLAGATPVPVEGPLPEGLAIFVTTKEVLAVDAAGAVRWRQANPCEAPVEPGPVGDPATAAVAAEVAAARFARMAGGDLILGDVAGAMRIEVETGKVRWRHPNHPPSAHQEARAALDLLREDLRLARTTGHVLRRHPLPAYELAGGVFVRVHPHRGVEALHADTGEFAWPDLDARGAVAVGPPAVLGNLMAIGWSSPGWVRIYSLRDGSHVNTFRRDGLVVVAPPVLDPLGRVVLMTSTEKDGSNGELGIFNVRGDEPALATSYRLPTSNAVVLYADGREIVYHDGASGTENLHFVDVERNRVESRKTGDMLRSVRVLADGDRLFVFSWSPGLEDEGARLLRIAPGRETLNYDLDLKAHAFARPLLTQKYVAVLASLPRGASVRVFDREASVASRGPQAVFVRGDRETATLDFPAAGTAHYGTPPGLAAAGEGLLVGHPFGTFRLQAR